MHTTIPEDLEKVLAGLTGQHRRNAELRYEYLREYAAAAAATAAGNERSAKRHTARAERANNTFAELNMGLVGRVVRNFQKSNNRSMHEDFWSAGLEGFVQAFRTWDPQRGTFGNWASGTFIKGTVHSEVSHLEHQKTKRVFGLMPLIRSTQERLRKELDREPTVAELAAATDLTRDTINEALAQKALSIDAPIGGDADRESLGDSLSDPHDDTFDDISPFDRADDGADHEYDVFERGVRAGDITPRECVAVLLLRGFGGMPQLPNTAAAYMLGHKRELLRGGQHSALRKIGLDEERIAAFLHQADDEADTPVNPNTGMSDDIVADIVADTIAEQAREGNSHLALA
jgi:DNA-directed RNA polymerase specialized sigma subunit